MAEDRAGYGWKPQAAQTLLVGPRQTSKTAQWTAYPITNSSVFVAEPEQFQPTSASIPSVSIPGFPLESIVVGLLLAIGVIYITKKKSLTSLPMSQKTFGQTH